MALPLPPALSVRVTTAFSLHLPGWARSRGGAKGAKANGHAASKPKRLSDGSPNPQQMWPWGHLAVAYLLYSLYTHRRFDRSPLAIPALAVAVGSQFPDLIDKPLAWTVGVLPGGRTLGHSLFFAALLIPAVYAVAIRFRRRDVGTAFVIGHPSHLAADVPPAALGGEFGGAGFLLWPLAGAPTDEPTGGIIETLLTTYSMGTYEWVQLALLAIAAVVWYRDGMPGLRLALAAPRRAVTAIGRGP